MGDSKVFACGSCGHVGTRWEGEFRRKSGVTFCVFCLEDAHAGDKEVARWIEKAIRENRSKEAYVPAQKRIAKEEEMKARGVNPDMIIGSDGVTVRSVAEFLSSGSGSGKSRKNGVQSHRAASRTKGDESHDKRSEMARRRLATGERHFLVQYRWHEGRARRDSLKDVEFVWDASDSSRWLDLSAHASMSRTKEAAGRFFSGISSEQHAHIDFRILRVGGGSGRMTVEQASLAPRINRLKWAACESSDGNAKEFAEAMIRKAELSDAQVAALDKMTKGFEAKCERSNVFVVEGREMMRQSVDALARRGLVTLSSDKQAVFATPTARALWRALRSG